VRSRPASVSVRGGALLPSRRSAHSMRCDGRGLLYDDRLRSWGRRRRRLRRALPAGDRLDRRRRRKWWRRGRRLLRAHRRCGGRRQRHLRGLGRGDVHRPRKVSRLLWPRPGLPAVALVAGALVAAVAGALVALVAGALIAPLAGALVVAVARTLAAPMMAMPGVGLVGMGHAGHPDCSDNTRDRERRVDQHRCSPAGAPMGWQLRHPAHGSDAGL
jgi:hypothetical protein